MSYAKDLACNIAEAYAERDAIMAFLPEDEARASARWAPVTIALIITAFMI